MIAFMARCLLLSPTKASGTGRFVPSSNGSLSCPDGITADRASSRSGRRRTPTSSSTSSTRADAATLVALVASLREPRTTIGGVNLVAGFRPELWAAVAPDAAAGGVAGFNEPLVGPTGDALPATQHDVVIWLTGAAYDVVFDLSRARHGRSPETPRLAHEIVGWPYHHDLRPDRVHRRHREPVAGRGASVALIPDGSAGRGRLGPAAPAVGARRDRRGRRCRCRRRRRSSAGGRPDSAEFDPRAADVARRAHRPGRVRQDLPAEHRVRDRREPRHDLRRLQRQQRILAAMLESMIGRNGPPDALDDGHARHLPARTTSSRPSTGWPRSAWMTESEGSG